MPYTYDHPRPALSVDCVLFGYDENRPLTVLLIQRGHAPFKGLWALPGGFVEMDEDLETAALRELKEETGLQNPNIKQLHAFGNPGRDPRGRVVSVAYYGIVDLGQYDPRADSDADEVSWFAYQDLPGLAFDHAGIISLARQHLRISATLQPFGMGLLPEPFTFGQLKKLYETILGGESPIRLESLCDRMLRMGILREAGDEEGAPNPPVQLYSFDKERYEKFRGQISDEWLGQVLNFEF